MSDVPWKIDSSLTIYLLTLPELASLPDGTVLTAIDGERLVKGKDKLDDDTRSGLSAFGLDKPYTLPVVDSPRSHQEETPSVATISQRLYEESRGDIRPDKIRELLLNPPTAAAIYQVMRLDYAASLTPSGEPGGAATDTERLDFISCGLGTRPTFEPRGEAWMVWDATLSTVRTPPTWYGATLRDAIDAAMSAMSAARFHQGEPKP